MQQADATNGGGRQDALSFSLIVKADIAADDGHVERRASFADAFNTADKLSHDLGFFGIAEVEVIRRRQGPRARRADIAERLCDGLFTAFDWVRHAVTRGDIGAHREGFLRAVDPHHSRIAAGELDRVSHDRVVVLLPHPTARA